MPSAKADPVTVDNRVMAVAARLGAFAARMNRPPTACPYADDDDTTAALRRVWLAAYLRTRPPTAGSVGYAGDGADGTTTVTESHRGTRALALIETGVVGDGRPVSLVETGAVDPDGGPLDDHEAALLAALDELDTADAVTLGEVFDPRQLRYPKGHPHGGRFRPMVDRLKDSIAAHRRGEHGGVHPFTGYSREQLRRVAKARGIELKRGEHRDSISEKLLGHLGGEYKPEAHKPEVPTPHVDKSDTPKPEAPKPDAAKPAGHVEGISDADEHGGITVERGIAGDWLVNDAIGRTIHRRESKDDALRTRDDLVAQRGAGGDAEPELPNARTLRKQIDDQQQAVSMYQRHVQHAQQIRSGLRAPYRDEPNATELRAQENVAAAHAKLDLLQRRLERAKTVKPKAVKAKPERKVVAELPAKPAGHVEGISDAEEHDGLTVERGIRGNEWHVRDTNGTAIKTTTSKKAALAHRNEAVPIRQSIRDEGVGPTMPDEAALATQLRSQQGHLGVAEGRLRLAQQYRKALRGPARDKVSVDERRYEREVAETRAKLALIQGRLDRAHDQRKPRAPTPETPNPATVNRPAVHVEGISDAEEHDDLTVERDHGSDWYVKDADGIHVHITPSRTAAMQTRAAIAAKRKAARPEGVGPDLPSEKTLTRQVDHQRSQLRNAELNLSRSKERRQGLAGPERDQPSKGELEGARLVAAAQAKLDVLQARLDRVRGPRTPRPQTPEYDGPPRAYVVRERKNEFGASTGQFEVVEKTSDGEKVAYTARSNMSALEYAAARNVAEHDRITAAGGTPPTLPRMEAGHVQRAVAGKAVDARHADRKAALAKLSRPKLLAAAKQAKVTQRRGESDATIIDRVAAARRSAELPQAAGGQDLNPEVTAELRNSLTGRVARHGASSAYVDDHLTGQTAREQVASGGYADATVMAAWNVAARKLKANPGASGEGMAMVRRLLGLPSPLPTADRGKRLPIDRADIKVGDFFSADGWGAQITSIVGTGDNAKISYLGPFGPRGPVAAADFNAFYRNP